MRFLLSDNFNNNVPPVVVSSLNKIPMAIPCKAPPITAASIGSIVMALMPVILGIRSMTIDEKTTV